MIRLLALFLALPAVLAGSLVFFVAADPPDECSPFGSSSTIDPATVPQGPIAGYGHEQLVNAAHIMSAAASLGLSARDQQIGVMTAMGESALRVLDHGDYAGPDSRGLFQQRANGAWGSYSDRMDPFTSSVNFFTSLATISDRDSMEPTLVANKVQGNADPYHYAPFWGPAGQVVQALRGTSKPVGSSPSGDSAYSLGSVQPQTATVANTVGALFKLRTIGGHRDASSVYDDLVNGHSVGLALDFMIDDIVNGRSVGDQIAGYLIDHSDAIGVAYIIWQQAIWSPDRAQEGWRAMPDRGSDTQNHMDHVHLSLTGTGSSATDPCAPSGHPGAVSSAGWSSPADGPISSTFGEDRTSYGLHFGLDIAAPCDAPIWAASAGTVAQAGPAQGYGNWVIVDHGGGLRTIYGHMYAVGVLVRTGDQVRPGQRIGTVGSAGQSSGCHLHFQVESNGSPIDPVGFLLGHGVSLPTGVNK